MTTVPRRRKEDEKRSGRMRDGWEGRSKVWEGKGSNRGYLFGMSVGVVRRNEFVDMNRLRGRGN